MDNRMFREKGAALQALEKKQSEAMLKCLDSEVYDLAGQIAVLRAELSAAQRRKDAHV